MSETKICEFIRWLKSGKRNSLKNMQPLTSKVNHIIIPQRANCLGKTWSVEKGERVWTGLYCTESVINEVWKYNVWLRHCAYINIHSDTYQCISVSSIIYLVTTGAGDLTTPSDIANFEAIHCTGTEVSWVTFIKINNSCPIKSQQFIITSPPGLNLLIV